MHVPVDDDAAGPKRWSNADFICLGVNRVFANCLRLDSLSCAMCLSVWARRNECGLQLSLWRPAAISLEHLHALASFSSNVLSVGGCFLPKVSPHHPFLRTESGSCRQNAVKFYDIEGSSTVMS